MSKDLKTYFDSRTSVNSKNVPHHELIKLMKDYYTKYNDFFASNGLVDCPTFGQLYKDKLMSVAKLIEDDYQKYIKESKNINHTFEVSTNPTYTTFFFAAANDDKMLNSYYEFLAYIIYSSMYRKYFKYGVKKPVMDKLYNEYLDNNSYIYKYGNIRKVLSVTVDTHVKDSKPKMINASDDDVLKVLNSLSTRVNLLLKKIGNKYYELSDSNEVMFEESNIIGEDTMILTNTDHNKIVSILEDFKAEEIKYSFNIVIYKIADPKMVFFENMRSAYKHALGDIFKLVTEYINTFIKKRNAHDIYTVQKYFASDMLSGSIKSFEITSLHVKISRLAGVSNSKSGEFRKVIDKYIALRIRQIATR